jgi:hypothetical protein
MIDDEDFLDGSGAVVHSCVFRFVAYSYVRTYTCTYSSTERTMYCNIAILLQHEKATNPKNTTVLEYTSTRFALQSYTPEYVHVYVPWYNK